MIAYQANDVEWFHGVSIPSLLNYTIERDSFHPRAEHVMLFEFIFAHFQIPMDVFRLEILIHRGDLANFIPLFRRADIDEDEVDLLLSKTAVTHPEFHLAMLENGARPSEDNFDDLLTLAFQPTSVYLRILPFYSGFSSAGTRNLLRFPEILVRYFDLSSPQFLLAAFLRNNVEQVLALTNVYSYADRDEISRLFLAAQAETIRMEATSINEAMTLFIRRNLRVALAMENSPDLSLIHI